MPGWLGKWVHVHPPGIRCHHHIDSGGEPDIREVLRSSLVLLGMTSEQPGETKTAMSFPPPSSLASLGSASRGTGLRCGGSRRLGGGRRRDRDQRRDHGLDLWKIRDDWRPVLQRRGRHGPRRSDREAKGCGDRPARLPPARARRRTWSLTTVHPRSMTPWPGSGVSLRRPGEAATRGGIGCHHGCETRRARSDATAQQTQGPEAAIAVVKTGRGRDLMDSLRGQVAVIHAEEDSRRRRLEGEMRRAITWTINLFAATSTSH